MNEAEKLENLAKKKTKHKVVSDVKGHEEMVPPVGF